jgi:small subunit ribosomal protein S21
MWRCARPVSVRRLSFTFLDVRRFWKFGVSEFFGSSAFRVQTSKFLREGVYHSLAEVKVQEGESIESALRRFKRKVQQEDIIKDIKKHSFYLKPGDRRRAKQALARKRTRKKQRRESD